MSNEYSAVIQSDFKKWVDNIHIDGLEPDLIENILKSGLIKALPDFYTLTQKTLVTLGALQDERAAQLIENIKTRKQMPLHVFLGSLNIHGCGNSVFECLIEQGYDTLDYILSLLPAHFEQIDGIEEKVARDIYMGLHAKKQLITDLLAAGIKIGPFIKITPIKKAPANTTLVKTPATVSPMVKSARGKSFCFTGTMSEPRQVLATYATRAGGTVSDSVNISLNYLVMADPKSNTVKARGARKMGVKTISEAEFRKMVGK